MLSSSLGSLDDFSAPSRRSSSVSDLLHLKVLEPADFQETLYLAKMRNPRKRLTDLCHNALSSLFVFSLTCGAIEHF